VQALLSSLGLHAEHLYAVTFVYFRWQNWQIGRMAHQWDRQSAHSMHMSMYSARRVS